MRLERLEAPLYYAFAAAVVVAAAWAFYAPAVAATHGSFPAPLDDVFIHFAFARSAALGRPFEWSPGNGYSSGGTSLLYPLALAPGWLVGLRGERLGWFAAALAVASLVDLCRSLRLLVARAPRFCAWLAPPLVVAVPLADWSFFSGMEAAFFAAVAGRAALACSRALEAPAARRPGAQRALGLWAAALFATRPEAAALAGALAVAGVHGARSLGTRPSLARTAGPAAALVVLQAIVNRALTSEWSAAGAVRKLVTSSPYATPIDAAIEVLKNLTVLRVAAFDVALGGPPVGRALFVLAVAAVALPGSRRVALALLAGALGTFALVLLNATAQFQNFRYVVPILVLLVIAAVLGLGALARRGRLGAAAGAGLAIVAMVAPAPRFRREIDHFAAASRNIAEQQVEVARRLAARAPRPRRVMVGDAGAIPYLSGLPALDGLGLGGYHDLPFARASVHGVPSVVELIERLDEAERPDVLALYPSWWVGLADVFGRRVDAVRIEGNVICAADEKVVYDADWSTLAPPREGRASAVDELDVADLVSERAHGYEAPFPKGGWVVGAVLGGLDGAPRFDGGRIVPEGHAEAFRVDASVPRGPARLALRTDSPGPVALRIGLERDGVVKSSRDVDVPAVAGAAWGEIEVPFDDVAGGDRVIVLALRGTWRTFHAWVLRPAPSPLR
jgi:hypothetical protein